MVGMVGMFAVMSLGSWGCADGPSAVWRSSTTEFGSSPGDDGGRVDSASRPSGFQGRGRFPGTTVTTAALDPGPNPRADATRFPLDTEGFATTVDDGGDESPVCDADDCPEGHWCDPNFGCRPGCRDDGHCPAGRWCDPDVHECVCPRGQHACGEACRDDDDVEHCGLDCVACPEIANGTRVCRVGHCEFDCDPGFVADHRVTPPQCRRPIADLDTIVDGWAILLDIDLAPDGELRVAYALEFLDLLPVEVSLATGGPDGWEVERVAESTMGRHDTIDFQTDTDGTRHVAFGSWTKENNVTYRYTVYASDDRGGDWSTRTVKYWELRSHSGTRPDVHVDAHGHVYAVGPTVSGQFGSSAHYVTLIDDVASMRTIEPTLEDGGGPASLPARGTRIFDRGGLKLLGVALPGAGDKEPGSLQRSYLDGQQWRTEIIATIAPVPDQNLRAYDSAYIVDSNFGDIALLEYGDDGDDQQIRLFRAQDPGLWSSREVMRFSGWASARNSWCAATADDGRVGVFAAVPVGEPGGPYEFRLYTVPLMGEVDERVLDLEVAPGCAAVGEGSDLHVVFNDFTRGLSYERVGL